MKILQDAVGGARRIAPSRGMPGAENAAWPSSELLFFVARMHSAADEYIRAAEELIETWPEIH